MEIHYGTRGGIDQNEVFWRRGRHKIAGSPEKKCRKENKKTRKQQEVRSIFSDCLFRSARAEATPSEFRACRAVKTSFFHQNHKEEIHIELHKPVNM